MEPSESPLRERVLWSGKGGGRRWRVPQVEVARVTKPGDVWTLVIETTDGAPQQRISSWWSPEERILGGTLAGWSTAAIGNIKRTLAQSLPPDNDGETP